MRILLAIALFVSAVSPLFAGEPANITLTTVNPFDANLSPAGIAGRVARLEREVKATNGMGLVARIVDTEGKPAPLAYITMPILRIEGIAQVGGTGMVTRNGWVVMEHFFHEDWWKHVQASDIPDKDKITRQFTIQTAAHEPITGEIPLAPGTIVYADIVLHPLPEDQLTSVSGMVLDEQNRPITETAIRLMVRNWEWGDTGVGVRETETGKDGRFTFEKVAPQSYSIQVGNRDYAPAQPPDIPVEQLGADHLHVLRFYKMRDVEIEYVYQPDGSRDFTAGNLQSRTATILADPNSGGFRLDTGAMVSNRDWRGIRIRDELGELQFYMRYVEGGSAKQGFYDAGKVSFESITEASEGGRNDAFSSARKPVNFNHVYVVRTMDGNYAKFIVRKIAPSLREPATASPFNILILTGGHGYDAPNFYKMFDDMPNVRYDKAEVPKDMDLLAPGLEKKYDLLLTYDMNNFPAITDIQRERFAALIELGMPLIVMHHSLCGHDHWSLYRQMIGGQYLHKALEIDGTPYPASSFKYGLDMDIRVMDKEHPITRGIENFTIRDEGYKNMYIRKGVHVLLKTDHPEATPEVAWTTRYGKSAIFAIALGHDRRAYENPNLRQILHQAIQWCIEETQKDTR